MGTPTPLKKQKRNVPLLEIWSKNPFATIFRRSKKHEEEKKEGGVWADDLPARSKSCDALNHGRLTTRFSARRKNEGLAM
jgi:hypothetical protein